MKNKFFTILLVIVTEMGGLNAQSMWGGTCGDNTMWHLQNGVLTITGTGAMPNWTSSNNAPWKNRHPIISVVVEAGVTSIGDYAFSSCVEMTTVTISNTVTSIGKNAFSTSYETLNTVTIPNSVNHIAQDAFEGCTALTNVNISDLAAWCSIDFENNKSNPLYYAQHLYLNSVEITNITIPANITSISKYAFSGFQGLTRVSIPSSVTIINNYAFFKCTNLRNVTFNTGVTEIGDYAFSHCSTLSSVTLPNSLKTIKRNAFSHCSELSSVTFPNSLKTIKGSAFSNCSSLTSITIPNSISAIESYAFSYCTSLASITIPESLYGIADGTFSGCSALTSITLHDRITSIGENAFLNCTGLTSINIPQSNYWLNLMRNAFRNCSSLDSIIIPKRVKLIQEGVFAGCNSLISIVVDTANASYDSRNNCNAIIEKSSNTLLSGCQNTIIPNDVTSIGKDAFYGCTGLTSINIPDSVTEIFESAFERCGLISVIIGKNVASIRTNAFQSCYNLINVVTKGTHRPALGNDVWRLCNSGIQLVVPCNSAPDYISWNQYFSNITEDHPYSVSLASADSIKGMVSLIELGCDSTAQIAAIPYVGYKFVQWNDGSNEDVRTIYLSQDTMLQAFFERQSFTITFLNWNGDTLQSELVYYDSIPQTPPIPDRPNSAQYSYNFVGWIPSLVPAKRDTTYQASFLTTINKYAISFMNVDGIILQSDSLEYGVLPTFKGATPCKTGYYPYRFVFIGWDPDVVPVTEDATYIAQYDRTLVKYLITFKNWDGTILQKDSVEYGTTPIYNHSQPKRDRTEMYSYTFSGWAPTITAVYRDDIYTATYDSIINQYTIIFVNDDDSVLQKDVLGYGEMPEYRGETPIKSFDPRGAYIFDRWMPDIAIVTDNAKYVATYVIRSGIKNTNEEKCPIKLIQNGQLYIVLPDGTSYDVTGRRIK